MATLTELKTRIIAETNREDLEDTLATQLQTHIARACEYYADTRFWFNAIATTATTTANTRTLAIPSGVRRIDRLTIPAYYRDIHEVTLEGLDDSDIYGVPDWYCYYNDSLRFYPIPDAAYTLGIYGLAQVDAPTGASDTNAWTNEAFDLICAHTRFTLYRDQFRDPDGAQLAKGAVADALARLQRETARRLETPRRTGRGRRGFNIFIGD